MTNKGFSPISHHLFEAVPGTNHWLRVKLKGVVSNRDGIGAKVKLQYGQGTQLREIRSNSSSLSGNELIAHFGLGQETVVTSLTIEWPSGAKQLINEPGIDQLHIVEEENNITAIEENSNTIAVYPNPTSSIIHIVSKFPMNAIKLTTAQGTEFVNIDDLNTDSYELSTTGIPEGLHVLEIISKKGKEIKKVVVKR
jgi:hypothetical protein